MERCGAINQNPYTDPVKAEKPTDSERLDWLERNLMHLSHDRTTCSVDMAGNQVRGQFVNEARGSGGGPSYFVVRHPTLRQAIDDAINWKKA